MNEPKAIALVLPYAQPMRYLPFIFSLLLCCLTSSHGASYTDGHEDGSLAEWTVVGTRTWSEANGYAIPQPDNASPGFLLRQAVVNDSDGTFEVNIRCVTGNLTNCKLGGPVFRWTATNAFFALALNELDSAGSSPGNQLYVLKNSIDFNSAQKIMLADSLKLGGHGRDYPFKITMQDSVFVVYLQDSTRSHWDSVGTWTDASNPSGQVGYGYYAWGENTQFSRSSWNGGSAPVNQAPTALSLSASTVDENAPIGSVLANLSATDPDASETFSYALAAGSGDTDNAAFSISGNQLLTAVALDFESKQSYTLRLRVTDAGGLSYSQAFTINVNDLNESIPVPSWTASSLQVSFLDSASRLLETRTWNREDTLPIAYGSHLRFTLALSSSSSLTVQTSSPQTGLEASWTDKGILVRWDALDTGLQVLEIIWTNASESDTALLHAYVKRNKAPVIALQNLGIFYRQSATFVSTQPPVTLDLPPERLLFHFLLQDTENDSIRFNILTDETSIEARREQDTLVLYWSHPLPSDTLLSLRLEDSQGNSTVWSLNWSYATTTSVRPVEQAGFRLLRDSQNRTEGFYLPREGRVILSTVDAKGALLKRHVEFMTAGPHLWSPRGESHAFTRIQWEGHTLLLP